MALTENRVQEISKQSAGTIINDRLTGFQSKAVAQFEPHYFELSRSGRVFAYSGGVVANAIAPVADVPTTASMYTLWNGESAGGKVLVPLLVSVRASSGTLGLGAALLCGVTTAAQASAVANSTGVVGPGYLGGSSSVTTAAKFATGVTLAGAPAWVAVASDQHVAAISVGAGIQFQPQGLFIVRPGFCLGIHVLAPLGTTAKFTADVIWAELNPDLV